MTDYYIRDTWEDTQGHFFNANPSYTVWNAYPAIQLDQPQTDYKRAYELTQTGYVYVHGWYWLKNVTLNANRIDIKGWFGIYHGYSGSRANLNIVIGVPDIFDQKSRPDLPFVRLEWVNRDLGWSNGSVGNYLEGYIILSDPPEYNFSPINPTNVDYNRITELVGNTINVLIGYRDAWSADWNQWVAAHKDSYITIPVAPVYTIELADSLKVSDKPITTKSLRITLEDTIKMIEPKVTSEFKLVRYLRYVKDHIDTFIEDDHNVHVDNWLTQILINEIKAEERRLSLPENEELTNIVYKMKYVQYKEKYDSKYHNLFVDAWEKQLEIDKKLWEGIPEAQVIISELEKVVSEMRYIYSGEYYHDVLHNLFKEAWDLQKELNQIRALPPLTSWPTFHHDKKRTGVSDGDSLVIDGATDGKIRAILTTGALFWEFQTGDRVYANPVVDSQEIIYVGSWDHFLYALDKGGNLLWKFETGDYVVGSPSFDESEEYLYFYSSDGFLYKLDREGNLVWKFEIGKWYELQAPSPLISDKIYTGACNDYVWALDREGNLVWKLYVEYSSEASPSLHDSGDIIVSERYTRRITPDGNILWSRELAYYAEQIKHASPIPLGGWIIQLGSDACLYLVSDDGSRVIYHGIDHSSADTPVAKLINNSYIYIWYSSYYYRFRFGVFDIINIVFSDIHYYDFDEIFGTRTSPCLDTKNRVYVPTSLHLNALSWDYEAGFTVLWRFYVSDEVGFSHTKPTVV